MYGPPEDDAGADDEAFADAGSGANTATPEERHALHLLPFLVAMEDPTAGKREIPCSAGCGSHVDEGGAGLYRCYDCFQPQLLCPDCLCRSHQQDPFHRVQRWNGFHFERSSLAACGLIMEVGHGGESCRRKAKSPEIWDLTVVDWNGIHKCKVIFCNCFPGQERHIQLFKAGLFPCSKDRPATAFTFTVLKHFQTSSVVSKTAAYDYHKALVRQTDGAVPSEVAVRGIFLRREDRI